MNPNDQNLSDLSKPQKALGRLQDCLPQHILAKLADVEPQLLITRRPNQTITQRIPAAIRTNGSNASDTTFEGIQSKANRLQDRQWRSNHCTDSKKTHGNFCQVALQRWSLRCAGCQPGGTRCLCFLCICQDRVASASVPENIDWKNLCSTSHFILHRQR